METPGRIAELERKFAENPRRYFAALANEFRKQGDLDRAIELCESHLAEQHNHLSGHVVLAQALVDAGRESDAWDPLHTALDLDPENFIALRLIGELSAKVGDVEPARTFFFRALEIEPRNEQLLTAVKNLSQRPAAAAAEPVEPPAAEVAPSAGPRELREGAWGDVAPLSGLESSTAFEAVEAAEPVAEEPPAAATVDDEHAPEADELPVRESDVEEPVLDSPAVATPAHGDPFSDWLPAEPAADASPRRADDVEARPMLASETMADLYLQQGHVSLAVEVLRELVASRPEDEQLRARLAEVERAPAAPPRETVRDMFARFARTAQPLRERGQPHPTGEHGAREAEPAGPLGEFFGDGADRSRDAGANALLAMVTPSAASPAEAEELEQWLAGLRRS